MNKKIITLIITFMAILLTGFTVLADESLDEAPVIEYEYIETEFIFVTNARVNLRAGSNTNSYILRVLSPNTQVEIISYDNGWFKVTYDEIIGFIREDLLTQRDPNAVTQMGEVQLLSWSEIRDTIVTLHTDIQVYDIGTGLTYYVRSFSNGLHADVETVTQADTDIMFQTFGRRWSWEIRPVIVTINGVSIAAAINGMPHAGGTIAGNGMNGHVCLHFRGSRTHNGNVTYTNQLQAAVMVAYNSR
ncbi:MAG: SH3 domain-containing protein [Defluviitaleaceae bacterium]|nr:SH3 domain-containing protein [Defluviitaleaceae bacterium]